MLGEEVKSQKVRTVTSWGSTLTGFLAEHLHKLGRMENVVELSLLGMGWKQISNDLVKPVEETAKTSLLDLHQSSSHEHLLNPSIKSPLP